MESASRLICDVCEKKFVSVSTKNRHLRTKHNKKVGEKKSQHIRCPLCSKENREALGNHEDLINHLTEVHGVSIKQSDLNFRNIEEFQMWRSMENRKVDYACARKNQLANGDRWVYYNCNRSDSYGYRSNCTKRTPKAGGSIRISGMCPSRILVKIFRNGIVNVKFIETHAGHEDELRTKRKKKQDQAVIVEIADEKLQHDTSKTNGQSEHINLNASRSLDFERERQIALDELNNYAKNLNEGLFDKFMDMYRTFRNKLELEKTNQICKKRKNTEAHVNPNKK